MKIYLVGGAVRDYLMWRPCMDRDWVVVGATPEQMEAQGFRPVGKDFPVYLHPKTKEEYALARRERNGTVAVFSSDVTLEEDLAKRDLTINAMAMEFFDQGTIRESYRVIDPHFGHDDILNKVLRMVSREAFFEDPIRVLRVARFAARYPDFRLDPDTRETMWEMVRSGHLDNLVPERVWKELSRGLMEVQPSRMLQVLRDCGALKKILPELDALYGVPQPKQWHPEIDTGIHVEQCLDVAATHKFDLPVRFAVMLHDLGKARTPPEDWPAHHGHEAFGVGPVEAVCRRLKVPDTYRHVAEMTAREHGNFHGAFKLKAASVVKILRRCDAFRRPALFQYALQAALCDARGRWGATGDFRNVEYPQPQRFTNALWAAKQINAAEVTAPYKDRPELIPAAIHAARARMIQRFEKHIKN